MEFQGICQKMHADLINISMKDEHTEQANIQYRFALNQTLVDTPLSLGQYVEISWTGNIYCTSCGKKTPKSYAQGHCFKCFKTQAECDMCIMKPETCHFHLGTCRDEGFAHRVCFQPHIIYLANSSALKVGITRMNQMPTRWLDQGASQALPIMKVGSRRLSGYLETMFGEQVSDKTDWRKLLKAHADPIDLLSIRDDLCLEFEEQIEAITDEFALNMEFDEHVEHIKQQPVREFIYPIQHYPAKIKSHNLDKTPHISGVLQGIKGQYLMMDTGVINLRKYTGYELNIRIAV